MARRTGAALFLALMVLLYVNTVHGFSLLNGDETGAVAVADAKAVAVADAKAATGAEATNSSWRSPYTLALHEQTPAGESGAAMGQGAVAWWRAQTYAVEPVFSLEFPKVVARDVIYTVTSPLRWDKKDWLMFAVGTAGVAAVALADKPVRTQVQHIQNGSATDAAKQIRQFGGSYSYGALGLFLAAGEVSDNAPAKAVFIDGAAATLISGGITLGLKTAIGRDRPSAELGNRHFRPFSGSESFPSGETTQAFAVASVIASHYEEIWIKCASYGIASLVGLARTYEDAHWTSDALAGALIGTVVGTAITHFNDKRRSKPEKKTTFMVTPLIAANIMGVGITVIY